MAVLTGSQLMEAVKLLIGESTTDEHLKLLEDMQDTVKYMESTASTDWEAKYNENDAAWRQRYKDRFFNTTSAETLDRQAGLEPAPQPLNIPKAGTVSPAQTSNPAAPPPDPEERAETIKPNDLFTYD